MDRLFVDRNLIGLQRANIIIAVLVLCFSVVPIIIEKNPTKAGVFFAIAVVALLLAFTAKNKINQYKQNKPVSRQFVNGLIVLYYINIMSFGIYFDVFENLVGIAGLYQAFLIVALFLFAMSPLFYLYLTLGAMVVFIAATVWVKIPLHWTYDIINALVAAIIGPVFGWQINRYRISAASGIRKAETIVKNLPGMVFQHLYNPPEYTYTFVSEGCEKLTGYSAEELIGKSAIKFLNMSYPDDASHIEKLSTQTFSKGLPYETTFKITTKDGTEKWIWERSRTIESNPDGSPYLIEGYYTDITKRRQLDAAEHEKKQMSSSIEAIISNLPGMAYQCYYNFPDYTLTFVSEGSKELIGYTPEELVGGVNKYQKMVHPDDVAGIEKRCAETLDRGLVYENIYRLVMEDGTIKWVWERTTVLEKIPDGSPNLVEGYVFDITGQRQLEAAELAELMLDTSPLCIQLWDRDLNTISCNEAAVKLYGFNNKQEYVERFIKDCSPKYQPDGQRSKEKAVMLVNRAFEKGRSVFDWMHQMPDGSPMPAEVTLVRVNYKEDYLVVGYTRDLRDVLRLEAEAEKIYYDALTGIYNRRFFDENLERYIKSISRSGSTLSLLMIDIDFFKKYNDTYGHSEGDNCLKIIAETLFKSITRTDDFVTRYGGEEFAVILPNTDENGARLIAEKLLQNVQYCNIPHEKSDVANCVTISIGVTSGKPKHTQNAKDYIKRADEMLYISKQEGRNRYTYGDL
jgi:diguanylate cyclase (GGDEF)-like protein/PAS domain S-box-containing protein